MGDEAVRLNKLYEAYAKKGFKLIVISPHPVAELQRELVENHKAKYWIGSDSRLATTIGVMVRNVVAEFPMTYLVDARGIVADYGDQLEKKIEYLLEEVFDPVLRRGLHRALKSARRSYDKGLIGPAWKSAGLKVDDADTKVAADAKYMRERCEAYGAWKQLMLEREFAAGVWPTIVPKLKDVEKKYRGLPAASWASTKRRELEKDPKVRVELKAWAYLQKAIAKEKKAGYDRKKMRTVRKQYKAIVDKYPGTHAAKEAQRLLDR